MRILYIQYNIKCVAKFNEGYNMRKKRSKISECVCVCACVSVPARSGDGGEGATSRNDETSSKTQLKFKT